MGPLFTLVLLVGIAFVILSLRNFYAPPSRFNLTVGRVAIVTFAALAAWTFWGAHRARNALTSAFYDLPVEPAGVQTVTLRKPPDLRGFRGRLVQKEDKKPASSALHEQTRDCKWEIPGKTAAFHLTGLGGSWNDALFDVDLKDPSIELRYTVTPETRPLLSQVLLEVTASFNQNTALTMGAGVAQAYMVGFLCAMLLAAAGVVAQRRKQRAGKPEAPPS